MKLVNIIFDLDKSELNITEFLKELSCIKCGHIDISETYHKSEHACDYNQRDDEDRNREHIHCRCRNCQYSWTKSIISKE